MAAAGAVFTQDATRSTKAERVQATKMDALPDSFRRNSAKEALVLEYVEHFRQQFVQLYPDRRALLLAPLNEANTVKFVCTTLRPTLMPLKELYDLQPCASFLASFIHYEPLEVPTEVPRHLPSPFFTLQARAGDCFEMATVLCSYLLGAGYDAYVVSGTAPRWVTLRLEDRTKCTWTPPPDAVDREQHTTPEALGLVARKADVVEPPGVSRYRLPPPPSVDSEFLRAAAGKAAAAQLARQAAERFESESEASDDEVARSRLDAPPPGGGPQALGRTAGNGAAAGGGGSYDELAGQRVHAWVLVRAGRRDVAAHTFVEPSTGAVMPAQASPYTSVESCWNNRNYYVNMQAQPLLPRQPGGGELEAIPSPRRAASGGGLRSKSPSATARVGKYFFSTAPAVQQPDSGAPGVPPSGAAASAGAAAGGGVDPAAAAAATAGTALPRFLAPYAASLEATGKGAAAKGLGAPVLGAHAGQVAAATAAAAAAQRRPPLRGDLTHRGAGDGGGGGGGSSSSGHPSGAATPAAPASAGSSRAPSRSRSRGHTKPGSGEGWRRDLGATQAALQARVAEVLAAQARGRGGVGSLAYDFDDGDEWEFVLIPAEPAAGAHGGAGAAAADDAAAGLGSLDLAGSGTGGGFGSSGAGVGAAVAAAGLDGGGSVGELASFSESKEDAAGGGRGGEDGAGAGDGGGGEFAAAALLRPGSGARATAAAAAAASAPLPAAAPPVPLSLERDGEHVLDLPQSWVPRLALDRYVARQALGAANSHVALHFKARLERYTPHSHPHGLVARLVAYADAARTVPTRVTEAFARRPDGLYKRVRLVDRQQTEAHYERERGLGGIALIVDEWGRRQEMYFYPGARVDGLLKRVHVHGEKISEHYGDTPDRLWYRSITLAAPAAAAHATAHGPGAGALRRGVGGGAAASGSPTPGRPAQPDDQPSSMTVEVAPPRTVEAFSEEEAVAAAAGGAVPARGGEPPPPGARLRRVTVPVEQSIRKMTEKYRHRPQPQPVASTVVATPAAVAGGGGGAVDDVCKVVYLVDAESIQLILHHAPGRITACSRLHHKVSRKCDTLAADPFAPVPRQFDLDNERRRLVTMEKECHNAARARARACLEIAVKCGGVDAPPRLVPTTVEVAMERARSGAPLEDEAADARGGAGGGGAGSGGGEIDYLLPFLLGAKCADPANPSDKEARRADRECRAAYKERLLERVAIVQKRLEAENDDLLRRQQAFSRNRDHADGAEEEFERYCAEATFRIGILEQRLERQEALVTKKYQELEAKLAADPRLAVIHNPAAAMARAAAAQAGGGGRGGRL